MRKIVLYPGLALLSLFLFLTAINPAFALEAKLSGQLNTMGMWADDGKDANVFFTDNDTSSSRFRFTGEETFGRVKAGVQFEFEVQRNPSNRLSINTNNDNAYTGSGTAASPDNNGFEFQDRWINGYLTTPFGKFELGKGDSAANNTAEVDLSRTSFVIYSDITSTGGGISFRNSDTGASVATISNTRSNFDGPLSRAMRARYNTPNFLGFYGSVAAENGGAWDASLWYAGQIWGKLAAGIGYTHGQRNFQTYETQLDGSISWLMPFGLNLTFSMGKGFRPDSSALPDPWSYYGKVGYIFGMNALAVEYGATKDLQLDGDKSSNWGVVYVITPWKPVDLYAAYRYYMLDRDGVNTDDIQVAMVGTRITF